MASGTPSNLSLGQRIIVGGLAIQLLFFGFFILVAAVFHHRMISNPTTAALSPQFPWRKHLLGLYGASTLIMARSIFRVAEYVQGAEGELLRHEVYLYVFDAAIMLILMVLLNVVHPGELSQLLKSDAGSVDLELQPKKSRSRSRGGGRLSRRGVHDPVSFADMTYARHAIATRGLA